MSISLQTAPSIPLIVRLLEEKTILRSHTTSSFKKNK